MDLNIINDINGVLLMSGEHFPASTYLIKVSNESTKTRCEICIKLTIKAVEKRRYCHSGIFIATLETNFTQCSVH